MPKSADRIYLWLKSSGQERVQPFTINGRITQFHVINTLSGVTDTPQRIKNILTKWGVPFIEVRPIRPTSLQDEPLTQIDVTLNSQELVQLASDILEDPER